MDLKNITYRTKVKLLPVVILLVSALVYSLTISKTIQLSRQLNGLEGQVERLGDAPLQIQMLKKRLKDIEGRIGNHSGKINREEIFHQLSNYCKQHQLILREFPEPHQIKMDNYGVDTYQLEVEGRYSNLLQMVYYLEKNIYLGKLSALHFLLKRDKRSREEYLTLSLFLQTVN